MLHQGRWRRRVRWILAASTVVLLGLCGPWLVLCRYGDLTVVAGGGLLTAISGALAQIVDEGVDISFASGLGPLQRGILLVQILYPTMLTLSLWPLTILLLCATAISWRKGRGPQHRCRSCGYDLTGNVSGICPECGCAAVGNPDAVATAAERTTAGGGRAPHARPDRRGSRAARLWGRATLTLVLGSAIAFALVVDSRSWKSLDRTQLPRPAPMAARAPAAAASRSTDVKTDEHTRFMREFALHLADLEYLYRDRPMEADETISEVLTGVAPVVPPESSPNVVEWHLQGTFGKERSFLQVQAAERYDWWFGGQVTDEWGMAVDLLPDDLYWAGVTLFTDAERELKRLLTGPGNESARQWCATMSKQVGSYVVTVTITDSDTEIDGPWTRATIEFAAADSD